MAAEQAQVASAPHYRVTPAAVERVDLPFEDEPFYSPRPEHDVYDDFPSEDGRGDDVDDRRTGQHAVRRPATAPSTRRRPTRRNLRASVDAPKDRRDEDEGDEDEIFEFLKKRRRLPHRLPSPEGDKSRLHETYEDRVLRWGSRDPGTAGRWEKRLLAGLEKLEKHVTRPRGVAEVRQVIHIFPEHALSRFQNLCFCARKPMGNLHAQRELLFFLPQLASRFPVFHRLKHGLNFVLAHLRSEKLQPAVARCVVETHQAVAAGCTSSAGVLAAGDRDHLGKNDQSAVFGLFATALLDRAKRGNGRSLTERKGCLLVLQQLLADGSGSGDNIRKDNGFIDVEPVLTLLKGAHELHEPLLTLIAQLLERKPGNFSNSQLTLLIAMLIKHLSGPSAKPDFAPPRADEEGAGGASGLPEEFWLTRDLAVISSAMLGQIGRVVIKRSAAQQASSMPDSPRSKNLVEKHRALVLGTLSEENLDLWRLAAGRSGANLRKSLRFCQETWKKPESASAVPPALVRNSIRKDAAFSKKGLVQGLVDGILVDGAIPGSGPAGGGLAVAPPPQRILPSLSPDDDDDCARSGNPVVGVSGAGGSAPSSRPSGLTGTKVTSDQQVIEREDAAGAGAAGYYDYGAEQGGSRSSADVVAGGSGRVEDDYPGGVVDDSLPGRSRSGGASRSSGSRNSYELAMQRSGNGLGEPGDPERRTPSASSSRATMCDHPRKESIAGHNLERLEYDDFPHTAFTDRPRSQGSNSYSRRMSKQDLDPYEDPSSSRVIRVQSANPRGDPGLLRSSATSTELQFSQKGDAESMLDFEIRSHLNAENRQEPMNPAPEDSGCGPGDGSDSNSSSASAAGAPGSSVVPPRSRRTSAIVAAQAASRRSSQNEMQLLSSSGRPPSQQGGNSFRASMASSVQTADPMMPMGAQAFDPPRHRSASGERTSRPATSARSNSRAAPDAAPTFEFDLNKMQPPLGSQEPEPPDRKCVRKALRILYDKGDANGALAHVFAGGDEKTLRTLLRSILRMAHNVCGGLDAKHSAYLFQLLGALIEKDFRKLVRLQGASVTNGLHFAEDAAAGQAMEKAVEKNLFAAIHWMKAVVGTTGVLGNVQNSYVHRIQQVLFQASESAPRIAKPAAQLYTQLGGNP